MKKTILKRAAALLLAALAAAGLAACGRQPEPDTLRIGVMYSSDIIPLAVMKDQKLDEKQGVVLDHAGLLLPQGTATRRAGRASSTGCSPISSARASTKTPGST